MLDRRAQLHALNLLAKEYPGNLMLNNAEVGIEAATVAYLEEHGLIKANWISGVPSQRGLGAVNAHITAKGMDFLAEDGGLSAILGTLTVKLHADTIRALLESTINQSSASPEEKNGLLAKVKSLPGKGLETLTTELVKLGLQHSGDIAHWLQTLGL